MYTLQDLVSHVLDAFDLGGDTVEVRRAKRAALEGFEMATKRHEWSRYNDEIVVALPGALQTGIISINAEGSVSLSGATWPSDATNGSLIVAEVSYRITERVSDSVVKIENWQGTASGVSRQMVYNRFVIPYDVRSIFDCYDVAEEVSLSLVSMAELRDRRRSSLEEEIDTPRAAAFQSVTIDGVVQTEMRVYPNPVNQTKLIVAYNRHPKSPRWMLDLGEVSVASNVLTTQKQISAGLVNGARVRISATPQSPDAEYSFRMSEPVLYETEGVAVSRLTQNTLSVSGIANVSGVGAVLTDALDIPEFLIPAVKQFAEASFRRTRTTQDTVSYATQMRSAEEELRYAMELDAPFKRRWNAKQYRVGRLVDHIVEG
jgi:hypothetical protein